MKKKIVAVIPARAGSKGVPNKNIRLLNGKPLIWYAINNAKESKTITDIIVTSDSEEIKIIAKQQGVIYNQRDEKLCRDAVTLDAVIYDAVKNIECDYVVTMQPTSPTLKKETLDAAVEYAIDNNVDTLISVVNKPHLAWVENNGKKVPAYKERLNRQFLPPYYMETGAFVISKRSVVTENTRIGKNVDVYPIDEDESIDIDNFYDLQLVNSILKESKVAIFANGNNEIGMGHICRALELADEFYCKPDIIYDFNRTSKESFGNTTHSLVAVDGIRGMLDYIKDKKYTLFINDILDTTESYMYDLKMTLPNCKIVNFEDVGNGTQMADAIINALYDKKICDNCFYGSDYYIAPKTFMLYEPIWIKDKVTDILITFGGADPKKYTERLLEIITKKHFSQYNFTVVLGRLKDNKDILMKYNEYDNIKILYNVKNMPEIMSKCDIAVTSRGRTTYELAMLGIPTIAMAQNDRENMHKFACSDNGFIYLGLNPSNHLIEIELQLLLEMSKQDRQYFQNMMLAKDLRNGRKRVVEIINRYM